MLRILLVDDEPLVLIGLQGMLEWEKLGYSICGTARNGKLALDLIEREQPLQHMELDLKSDSYLVASCELCANTDLTPSQQLKLSFSCARMLENTLRNYLPCYVTGADVLRCNVLFCLTAAQSANYRALLRPLLEKASQILYNYFTVRGLWAVGRPVASLLGLSRRCRENAHLRPLLTAEKPIQFVEIAEGDATAGKMQVVAQVQDYIRSHLSEKLGYESSFYFSKVFKKVTGLSPREYQQSI